MVSTELIVVAPWVAFGLSVATVCLRLGRFRRFPVPFRKRASRAASDDDNGSSANTGEPGGNPHHRASVPSSEADRPASRGPSFLQRSRR